MMYFDTKRHNEPHIHITYNEYMASISLNGVVLSGGLPVKQLNIVKDWIHVNYKILHILWDKAKVGKHIGKI